MSPVQDICPTARVRLVGGAPATCGRPPQAGSRQGLRYSLPVTKANSRINQTHCSGISTPHRPASKGLPPRIENLHCSHAPGPSPSPPPHPGACSAIQAGASTQDFIAASHEPRAATNPSLPMRCAAGKSTRRQDGALQNSMQRLRRTSTSSRVSCPAGSSAPLRPHEHQRTYRP